LDGAPLQSFSEVFAVGVQLRVALLRHVSKLGVEIDDGFNVVGAVECGEDGVGDVELGAPVSMVSMPGETWSG
jgi:hypothetical protein